jgi:hypothetical protein
MLVKTIMTDYCCFVFGYLCDMFSFVPNTADCRVESQTPLHSAQLSVRSHRSSPAMPTHRKERRQTYSLKPSKLPNLLHQRTREKVPNHISPIRNHSIQTALYSAGFMAVISKR